MGKQCPKLLEWRVASPNIKQRAKTTTPRRAPQQLQMQDTLQKILEAIEDSKNSLQEEIWKVSTERGLLRTDHQKLVERVDNAEKELNEMDTSHRAQQTQLGHLTDRVQRMEHRAGDAEGHSRRNNFQIVGLLEGVEGSDIVAYLEPWMKGLMGPQQLMPFFALERAHRLLTRPPTTGRPPRPVVANLLHCKDRDLLLQRAHEEGPFDVENSRVSMYSDYTAAVQAKRASYTDVRKALRTEGI
ncbi:hypothetical protein NDU88_003121 [Pleurodeles waltl]|uniref:Uncharacterized protein n=1 Tax=Pleurodeles waltl TaxID=8319 RepID=A0AAV7NFP9_PLEWA|nr:hypothetical protein NDU88_003121 [Pleurodeles waltl]